MGYDVFSVILDLFYTIQVVVFRESFYVNVIEECYRYFTIAEEMLIINIE